MGKIEMTNAEQYYTSKQVGEALGVAPRTVLRWIQQGRLAAQKFGPRSYRISKEAFDKFCCASKEAALEKKQ